MDADGGRDLICGFGDNCGRRPSEGRRGDTKSGFAPASGLKGSPGVGGMLGLIDIVGRLGTTGGFGGHAPDLRGAAVGLSLRAGGDGDERGPP